MAYQQQAHMYQQPQDVVSGDEYRYALTNFRIAHEKVEQQRLQLEEQERQVALLHARISLLEGGATTQRPGRNGNTIDDFSIKNAASQLDKLINRWAADIVRSPPVPIIDICHAILTDVATGGDTLPSGPTSMQVQSYLRHAMAETISEGIINCFIVTNSSEANIQLTRIHEHIFANDPTVASVWRRQTFSAAVDTCTPQMSLSILHENVPSLTALFLNAPPPSYPSHSHSPPPPPFPPTAANTPLLDSAYSFSRMLHSAPASASSSADAFYRAFVPEIGSTLYPRQIELVKRCIRSERGEGDRVGATIFPGLVKVTRGAPPPGGTEIEHIQTVVRRAQVICECAMGVPPPMTSGMPAYERMPMTPDNSFEAPAVM